MFFFAAMIAVRANEFVTFLNILAVAWARTASGATGWAFHVQRWLADRSLAL